jgi:hypothetical protein
MRSARDAVKLALIAAAVLLTAAAAFWPYWTGGS